MDSNYITSEIFKKRIVNLCLKSGLKEFPAKQRDKAILLKSIVNYFEKKEYYQEAEVNGYIKKWLEGLDCFQSWDHITLRRYLVDEHFLTRSQDGSCYQVNPTMPGFDFESSINELDIVNIINEAQLFIAQKKDEYLKKQAKV